MEEKPVAPEIYTQYIAGVGLAVYCTSSMRKLPVLPPVPEVKP